MVKEFWLLEVRSPGLGLFERRDGKEGLPGAGLGGIKVGRKHGFMPVTLFSGRVFVVSLGAVSRSRMEEIPKVRQKGGNFH